MAERRRRRLSPRAAEGLVWATLLFCPLALGTVQGWPVLGMLVLSCLALLATALASDRIALPTVGIGLAALAGYVGLQLLPLPDWLLRLLSPQGAATYRFALDGLAPGGWHPITLDGPATARDLTKALAEAAFFLAAWQVAGGRRSRRRLAIALAGSGLTLALLGYGHLLANAHELFGQPIFRESAPPFVTTFGNKNNAAGFLSLCAPVALGLALRGRDRRAQALWGLCYVLVGAAVFLCLSRGAICAFLVSQLALGALLWVARERTPNPLRPARSPRAAVGAICAAAVAVSVAAFLGYEPVVARLATLDSVESLRQEGKLQGFVDSLSLLRDFPLTGIGRGAFPTVGGQYLAGATGTAEFIENEPLQALADLGWPVGGALLLLLAWAFARALARPGLGPLDYGLAAGLLSLGLQNLVDFSLELGGVAVPALAALALLVRRPQEGEPARAPRSLPRPAVLAGALAALGLGAAVFPGSLHDWRNETDAFAEAAPKLTSSRAEAAALPLIERHPASFVVPFAVAERFLLEGKAAQALHWLNRALYFKPNLPAMHLVAEGALAELGRKDQCLLEARLYFEQSGGALEGLVVAQAHYPALADLAHAVPETGRGLASLATFLENANRRDDALAALREATALDGRAAAIHQQMASLLSAKGDGPGALAEVARARELAPDDPTVYAQQAAALRSAGRPGDAVAALADGLRRRPGEPGLVFALADLLLAVGNTRLAGQALDQLSAAASLPERARAFAERARIYAAEGRTAKAEEALRTAARMQPAYRWQLVDFLEQQSEMPAAIQLLRELGAGAVGANRAAFDRRIEADERREQALDQAQHEALLLAPPGTPPAP